MDDATWTRRRWISAGGGLLWAMHAWRGASAADDAVGSSLGSSLGDVRQLVRYDSEPDWPTHTMPAGAESRALEWLSTYL